MTELFSLFDQVRIINLVDRPDRRSEMIDQFRRIGGMGPNIAFHDAHRPSDAGEFPSVGARGCFASHLAVLRGARDAGAKSLLLLEDDFDFAREGFARANMIADELMNREWHFFYGAHVLPTANRRGLVRLAPDEAVITASFVGFNGTVIADLVDFLEAILTRPAGSPDYGPMHVDGAYTVFRELHPRFVSFAAFPTLGRQRSSPSDITPGDWLLDRHPATRGLARSLRSTYNWLARRARAT